MPALIFVVAVIAASLLVWHGSIRLESAAENPAAYYGFPPVVQGAVIAAVGSSFPELAATVLSTAIHGEFDLGVSVVVGSAVFNILLIRVTPCNDFSYAQP